MERCVAINLKETGHWANYPFSIQELLMFSLVSHIWTAVLLKFGSRFESMKEFGISLSFFLIHIKYTHSYSQAHTQVSTFVHSSISHVDIRFWWLMAKQREGLCEQACSPHVHLCLMWVHVHGTSLSEYNILNSAFNGYLQYWVRPSVSIAELFRKRKCFNGQRKRAVLFILLSSLIS